SAVRERYRGAESLKAARTDMMVSVVLGGFISMAIVITASMAFFGSVETPSHAGHLAMQLQPVWGESARYLVGIGLFAAGISSAITAPLAAAYATAGILGWKKDLRSWRFRTVWMVILLTGVTLSLLGLRPLEVIVFAQAANGILLPVIAIYLLWVVNSQRIMGSKTNSLLSNLAAIAVVAITLFLGMNTLLRIFGVW
ncbi:MAG: NRAMP family divalent metal transporter, partial [Bacteroidota bacterium]